MFSKRNVTLDDLNDVAAELAGIFKGGDVVLFSADMGAGKTTLISHLAKSLGVEQTVTSPTFAIVETYDIPESDRRPERSEGSLRRLIHIDTYRLTHVNELYDLGLETLFDDDALTLIEWGDRIEEFVDKNHYVLSIEEVDEDTRNIELEFVEVGK